MKHLFCTRGAPGSGKSTWIKENGLEQFTLSADSLRLLFQSPVFNVDGRKTICPKNDKRVWDLLLNLVEERMARGEFIVVDATHSKSSDWSKYKKMAEDYRYRVYSVDFTDRSLKECLWGNVNRAAHKFVPEAAIENLWTRTQTQLPPSWVKRIKPNEFQNIIALKPLDFNHYENVYIFSDVHSSYEPLKAFWDECGPTENDAVIFAGDWFDRNDQASEVLKFWVEHYNRPNFLALVGNHDEHFAKWAFLDDNKIRSNEFLYKTRPQLEKSLVDNGWDKGLMRNLYRKMAQFSYFSFDGKNYFVNHAGIPTKENLAFTATQELIKGVGKYEEVSLVADSWIRKEAKTEVQVIGHRNVDELSADYKGLGRFFLLEGRCEFGGHLRVLKLFKGGYEVKEYKNNHITATLDKKEVKVLPNTSNQAALTALRASKDVYEKRMGHISSFNFNRDVFYSNKWNEVSKFARGLFFNTNGDIVARFGLKCFNYEQVAETQERNLKKSLQFPVSLYLKCNGFLGILGFDSINNSVVFCSKSTINGEFAENFERIFRAQHNDILESLTQFLKNENLCLAFEVIDPVNDPHIIEYPQEQVVLLDAYYRTIETKKLPYEELQALAQRFGFEVKDYVGDVCTFNDLLTVLKSADGEFEGYMLEDVSGFQFKYKTPFYSFWKSARSLCEKMSKGHTVNLGWLTTPAQNLLYAWLQTKSRDYLARPIIDIRNDYLEHLAESTPDYDSREIIKCDDCE